MLIKAPISKEMGAFFLLFVDLLKLGLEMELCCDLTPSPSPRGEGSFILVELNPFH